MSLRGYKSKRIFFFFEGDEGLDKIEEGSNLFEKIYEEGNLFVLVN